jgi:hypothetical protein
MTKYFVVGLGVLSLIGVYVLIKKYRDFDESMQDVLGCAFNSEMSDKDNWGM